MGGLGNDTILGQVDNDYLNGGPGTDTCDQGQTDYRFVDVEIYPWRVEGDTGSSMADSLARL